MKPDEGKLLLDLISFFFFFSAYKSMNASPLRYILVATQKALVLFQFDVYYVFVRCSECMFKAGYFTLYLQIGLYLKISLIPVTENKFRLFELYYSKRKVTVYCLFIIIFAFLGTMVYTIDAQNCEQHDKNKTSLIFLLSLMH